MDRLGSGDIYQVKDNVKSIINSNSNPKLRTEEKIFKVEIKKTNA